MKRPLLTALATATLAALGALPPAAALERHAHQAPRLGSFHLQALTDAVPPVAPTAAQMQAAEALKARWPEAEMRFDPASGSLDSLIHIVSDPHPGTAEEAALDFVRAHGDLFGGLRVDQLRPNARLSRPALGGQLLRFDQVVDGIRIEGAGLGMVLDGENRIRAVFGPVFPQVSLDTQPGLGAAAAVSAASLDLRSAARTLPSEALAVLEPGFAAIESQLGPLLQPQPELRVVMNGTQPRLVWSFYQYSRNPFGLFKYAIDARSGRVLERLDQVRYQESPVEQYADYFPTFPAITPALRSDCAVLDANGGETGRPLGQARILLRKFDQSNRASGVEGVLTGQHAFIQSALPTRIPFAQAALGTYFFDADEAPVKGRTDERDHLKEPAQQQDGISQFIYITGLLEYLDYLHKAGDAISTGGFGSGAFPDSYPNESTPLTGTVHIPNVLAPPEDISDPQFLDKLLGLDNAFAIPVATEIGGQEVVVNPTAYGHGFLLNNLAIDFSVPMHEGTHATITPIAGFEGFPEGPALNEGQADLWAYTIGETPDLGTYPVNACGLLAAVAEAGGDPESYQFIRSAQSQIRYSQLGTRDNQFEEHRDGEIYAGAMWDIREFMLRMYPEPQFRRPDPVSGQPTQLAPRGKDVWERLFLGAMYVLGTSSPDTMVRSRDAMLVADSLLYPSDPTNPGSRGRHAALIERAFAARELGLHSAAPLGGRQTVSTAVSEFTAQRSAPAVPQKITARVVDAETVAVEWQPVEGVLGYQVLKRRSGDPRRLFEGVPGREYYEGDARTNGYTHVEYVLDGTRYADRGQGLGRGPGQGLDSLEYEYAVRAIGRGSDGQVGFSKLSGNAKVGLKTRNVSDRVSTRASNLSFTGASFSFDQQLRNDGSDALFAPLRFEIRRISEPSVSVANADNGGAGRPGDTAVFTYDQSLDPGELSAPRRLVFSNPEGRLFTFKARVRASTRFDVSPARGQQDPVDSAGPNEAARIFHYTERFTGLVPLGSAGLNLVDGVDHVDIEFVARDSAVGVVATLTASPEAGGAYPDLDFALLDAEGNQLASSGNLGPDENLTAAVTPGETYRLRVIGFANGPTVYEVFLDQIVSDQADAGTGPGSQLPIEGVEVEYQVNPLTGQILRLP
ncbi:M36 family metallopeptidase [Pseudomarimonas salicorniae]|uniref:M36 family metallopeptidase n=1 Tax=Pseudomarimonas salicorniae TaxID=2933270 RepID=A0ABT0GGQ7_9GAMM|nr:M36 family metallopeptidase [Lysobacter sp. CAU 1642]MCK7593384.1 M36 family metallopeptidase [Lysobacter sp. CAU 1642]